MEPLHDLIASIGGWPVLNSSWDEADFRLEERLAAITLTAADPIIAVWIGADARNTSANIIQVLANYTGMFPVGDTSCRTLIAVCACVCVCLSADISLNCAKND